jgi:hypothetical protein
MKFRYSHKDFPAIIIIDTDTPENAKAVLIQNVRRPGRWEKV